jgi:ribulose-5-phosphate 4-epimerase/fuculose-1-phosphate aldolase
MDIIKKKLAICYQSIAKREMDDLTYTHLSARSSKGDSFFIQPFGLKFEEVTAESLIEVSFDGKIIHGTASQYNETGYEIHASIYKARSDINASFHLHTTAGVAVSAMKFGLIPISQFALHFYGMVSYHDYNSLVLHQNHNKNDLVDDLGKNKVMFLRNHGTLTTGSSIEEAMFYTHHLEQACKVQVQALAAGYSNLIIPNENICKNAAKDLLAFEQNLGQRDFNALSRNLKRVFENC